MGAAERLSAAREALEAAEAAASASGLRPASRASSASGQGGAPGQEPGHRRQQNGGRPAAGVGGAPDAEPDPHAIARKIVLRQLAMGPRTRRQLEDKLRDRGCDPQVAGRVLDRMGEVGLVDDEAYTEMYVRSRQETKGLAATAIRQELRAKGVADDVIDTSLEEIDPEHEKEQARALVARRLRTMRGLDKEAQTRRLAGFLARKGYGSGVSYQVVREALDDLPEHARD